MNIIKSTHLRKSRKRNNLTISEFANQIQVDVVDYDIQERGISKVSRETVSSITKTFGVTSMKLFNL